MAEDVTTLELAERIARAVLKQVDDDELVLCPHDEYFVKPHDVAYAVLRVLYDTNTWFSKLRETGRGTVTEQLPLLEVRHDG